jgi:TolA-binding protein
VFILLIAMNVLLQTQNEMQLRGLTRDLDELKKTKVKLMRQMKEEIAKNKKREAERERQISQLKKESRKREIQIKNMESEKRQRELVLKRKQEEVTTICNNSKKFLLFYFLLKKALTRFLYSAIRQKKICGFPISSYKNLRKVGWF